MEARSRERERERRERSRRNDDEDNIVMIKSVEVVAQALFSQEI